MLYLCDGSTFHHPGPALAFYTEAMSEINAGHDGPIMTALRQTVRAKGCGKLYQLLWAVMRQR
jgi:hypothetical protein